MTEWRKVPGYPEYEVSSDGRVRSWRNKAGAEMKPSPQQNGYLYVTLWPEGTSCRDGRGKRWAIHRLVLLAFVGPSPEDKPLTRHLDGNPGNNRLENLAWGNNAENCRDRTMHGRDPHANRSHCKNGHEFNEENTYWRVDGHGRMCRRCRTENEKRYRIQRNMAAAAACQGVHPGVHCEALSCPGCGQFSEHSWDAGDDRGGVCVDHGPWSESAPEQAIRAAENRSRNRGRFAPRGVS